MRGEFSPKQEQMVLIQLKEANEEKQAQYIWIVVTKNPKRFCCRTK